MEKRKSMLPKRLVAARYNVVPRTVERWIDAGIMPHPEYINKRTYWDEHTLDAWDAARKSAAVDASHGGAGIEAVMP